MIACGRHRPGMAALGRLVRHEQTAERYDSNPSGAFSRARGILRRFCCRAGGMGLGDRQICSTRSSMVGCTAHEHQRYPDFDCDRRLGFRSLGELAGKSVPLFTRILSVQVLPSPIQETSPIVRLRRCTGGGDYSV